MMFPLYQALKLSVFSRLITVESFLFFPSEMGEIPNEVRKGKNAEWIVITKQKMKRRKQLMMFSKEAVYAKV